MKYIIYPIKNLIHLIRTSPVFFAFLIIGQSICVTSSFVVYALIQNTQIEEENEDWLSEDKTLTVSMGWGRNNEYSEINLSETYTIDELDGKIKELAEYIGKDLLVIDIFLTFSENVGSFDVNDRIATNYVLEDTVVDGWTYYLEDITKKDYKIGSPVEGYYPKDNYHDVGDEVRIGDYTYEVNNNQKYFNYVVTYGALPWGTEGVITRYIRVCFKKPPSYKYVKKLEVKLNELFPDNPRIRLPEVEDLEELQKVDFIRIAAVLIVTIIILNVSIMYLYILKKRYKWLAILRMCGCKRYQVFTIYFLEIMAMLAFSISVGYVVFIKLAQPLLIETYPLISELFKLGVNRKIIELYSVISVLVMSVSIIPLIRKTVVDMKREGGR